MELEKEQSIEYRKKFIGSKETVLFEESKNINGRIYAIGHTTRYVKVVKETEENLSGKIMEGKIIGQLNDEILVME